MMRSSAEYRIPIVRFEGITKEFIKGNQHFCVLENVSLDIWEGEFIAVMGPSGAGKSTLLNLMGCLDRPTSGRYLFFDRDISDFGDRELSLLRATQIGFIFQNYNLLPYQNLVENTMIPFLYRPHILADACQWA